LVKEYLVRLLWHHINFVELNRPNDSLSLWYISLPIDIGYYKWRIFALWISLRSQLGFRWGVLQSGYIRFCLISIYSNRSLSSRQCILVIHSSRRPWSFNASTDILATTRHASTLCQPNNYLRVVSLYRTCISPFKLVTNFDHACSAWNFTHTLINAPLDAKLTFMKPITLLNSWSTHLLLDFFQWVLVINRLSRYKSYRTSITTPLRRLYAIAIQVP